MNNPANEKDKSSLPMNYQPMSQGTKKLDVPEREGYNRRWFRGDAGRINRALRAGYQFVDPTMVDLNNFDLGGDAKDDGNTDLGTRVSIVSGDGMDNTGQPSRLYLMECPVELYERSQKVIEDRNESVAEALRGGSIGAEGDAPVDKSKRYVKSGTGLDLFIPKNKRRV